MSSKGFSGFLCHFSDDIWAVPAFMVRRCSLSKAKFMLAHRSYDRTNHSKGWALWSGRRLYEARCLTSILLGKWLS